MTADTNKRIAIVLDGQPREVESGLTILEAADRCGVYIPTLCTHKDLSPFGACRMCIVEVEGMKGFPTACTTPVQDGMVVRTESERVRQLRLEVLRLTLSQHTCGCLVCDDSEQCRKHSETVRKAGVTTGCKTCPSDGRCELQTVAERIGLDKIDFPVYYRELPVEKYDPFYDRDYNLCILCGRCVRVCQDLRGTGALAFQQRGNRTVIGPAFGQTHLDAGCEFCGDCVTVCPTGALSEKVRKWDGEADREEITVCPLCGVGCQVKLLVKNERVVGSLPATSGEAAGELCVKGRFCLAELVNDRRRLKGPRVQGDAGILEVDWESAIEKATERLKDCPPERFAMIASPNCTNEDLYIAQKFARVAMRSNRIDTGARLHYGSNFWEYLGLLTLSGRLADIREASVILCVGLDARFGRSVVGVELRKAVKRGAKVITIHPRGHSLSLVAEEWLRPAPGLELAHFTSLFDAVEKTRAGAGVPKKTDLGMTNAARLLAEAARPLVLVGPDVLHYSSGPRVLESIGKLARAIGAGVLALPAHDNLIGSILMGTYPELLPGGFASSDAKRAGDLERVWGAMPADLSSGWTTADLDGRDDLDVLYLVGEVPGGERPSGGFVIFQNMFPAESLRYADLVLPSAAFSEVDGTVVSGDGLIRRVRKAVEPRGAALPDWEILCRIARSMGVEGFDFENVRQVYDEISGLVAGLGDFSAIEHRGIGVSAGWNLGAAALAAETGSRDPQQLAAAIDGDPPADVDNPYPFVLTASADEHTYKGFAISNWVAGAREIFVDECVDISPEDAAMAGVGDGDIVWVRSATFERRWRARVTTEIAGGSLHVTLRPNDRIGSSPHFVNIRKCDV
jgi:predicted molibdopterin-dependent oxidoreductase YjgC